jgi:sugar/nucleoside kinase (ribokinase family)
MTTPKYAVTGIGNAIVDIIAKCDDDVLKKIGATKGSMRLVSADDITSIYSHVGQAVQVSGGSAANTIAGVASFGGTAAFMGKIADDDFGRIFAHDIKSIGVTFNASPVKGAEPTSRSLIIVTKDGERTMNTYLGISTSLDKSQVDDALIRDSGILYLEGYLFDRDGAKDAFRSAVATARSAGRTVALSLSDGFCVDRHRGEFLDLIRSGIGILFANESEIKSLYETQSFDDAASRIQKDTALAVLTRSGKGSIIIDKGIATHIHAERVTSIVDTTGAGDLYAAGFLFGYARGLSHQISGRLASIAAAEVISHIGARPAVNLADLAQSKGISLD